MSALKKSTIPPCLLGFNHIKRFADKREPVDAVAVIKPGEYYVTRHDEIISTVLGSCISVCVYDPDCAIGGMNHFMLPEGDASATANPNKEKCARFGNFAMEKLVNDLLKNGGRRNKLKFKLFGGSDILPGSQNVGARNIQFIKNFLSVEGYGWEAEDVGGKQPRKVKFYPMTGRVRVLDVAQAQCTDVLRDELRMKGAAVKAAESSGDVELF